MQDRISTKPITEAALDRKCQAAVERALFPRKTLKGDVERRQKEALNAKA
jgi:hypothetical protein